MKQSILALAALAALSHTSARAQDSVQLYGLVDAGVEAVNHAGADGGGLVRVVSGGKNTSRWGVRGSEDLGGGLKAVFNLEGGILIDSGAADGALFKRQAWVGLEGDFGRLVIGRSFTTTYDLVIKFDPLGFAPHYSWATSGGATGPSKYGMTTSFDNLVKYKGTSGGFTYGATVGLGEQGGGTADGRKLALGGSWFGGGLGLMAAWEQVNGSPPAAGGVRARTTAFHLGADYKHGPWRYSAGMRGYKLASGQAATADLRGDTYWGGITRTIGPVTLTGAAYHINTKERPAGQDADPTMLVVRAMLALSKRTDLYLSAAHARADDGQLVGLSRDDAGTGTTQSGVTAGIQRRF
ncbi:MULTISPECIES: porin [unclassified Massilia]|uniref:porin n=1 Tax=unclassified Massilia TaxID=2609279 RepID=UPI00177D5F21|nr:MULTISPECIES: porin [unclassified Massilia]MBD8529946.1 porin [Massilia sp. CFBP 13647]MBD8673857.1 porin [Massilia sp. CFBP 13721]